MSKAFLCLILSCLFPAVVHSQTDLVLQTVPKAPATVHYPDLSKLEESVRDQITAAQDALAAALKNPAVSDAALLEAYVKLGQLYHAYSFIPAARECYLAASQLASKDFRWIYLLGKLDQQEGRFDEAIKHYREAQRLRLDYLATLVNLGNIFLELNRLEEASESFQAALKIRADDPAAHYGLGQVAVSQRKYAEAVEHFEKTLALVPSANRVHYSLAMAYRGLGNSEKMKAHLAQQGPVGVRVSDPLFDSLQGLITGERVYLSRGKIAFEAGRYAEAVNEFRKAVAAKPGSITARVNLGAALKLIDDVNGAVEQFQEALRLDPTNVNANYNLAIILAGQNKHEQALAHIRTALSVDPNDLNARYLLAEELRKSGVPDEALNEYSRVVQADPNHESALLEQVKLLYRKGEFRQALDGLEKGHAQYPQKGRTVVMLAYLLAASPQSELRNGSRALELAQRVYAVTHDPAHGALVALALAELGRCSEAAEWQRQMIAAAEKQNQADLPVKLRAGLKQVENARECRPGTETALSDFVFPARN